MGESSYGLTSVPEVDIKYSSDSAGKCPFPNCDYQIHNFIDHHGGLHVFDHQQTKHVICDVCSKVFASHRFNAHMRSEHLAILEARRACNECGEQFASLGKLRVHALADNHALNASYACKEPGCGSIFFRKPELER